MKALRRARDYYVAIPRRKTNWAELVNSLVLVIVVLLFSSYIYHRQNLRDHQVERERVALCSIFDTIPMGASVPVDNARIAYRCGPPKTPHVVLTPSP